MPSLACRARLASSPSPTSHGRLSVPQSSTRSPVFQQVLALEMQRLARQALGDIFNYLGQLPWYRFLLLLSFFPKMLAHGVAQALRYLSIRPVCLFDGMAWPPGFGRDDHATTRFDVRVDTLKVCSLAEAVGIAVNRAFGLELNKSFLVSLSWASDHHICSMI